MLLLEKKNPPHDIFQSDRGLWDCTVFFFFFSVAILSAGRLSGATAMCLLLESQNNCLTQILGICPWPMVVVWSCRGPRMVSVLGYHACLNGLCAHTVPGVCGAIRESEGVGLSCQGPVWEEQHVPFTQPDMDWVPAKCWPRRGGFIPEPDRCLPSWRPHSNELPVFTPSWTAHPAPEKVA